MDYEAATKGCEGEKEGGRKGCKGGASHVRGRGAAIFVQFLVLDADSRALLVYRHYEFSFGYPWTGQNEQSIRDERRLVGLVGVEMRTKEREL